MSAALILRGTAYLAEAYDAIDSIGRAVVEQGPPLIDRLEGLVDAVNGKVHDALEVVKQTIQTTGPRLFPPAGQVEAPAAAMPSPEDAKADAALSELQAKCKRKIAECSAPRAAGDSAGAAQGELLAKLLSVVQTLAQIFAMFKR